MSEAAPEETTPGTEETPASEPEEDTTEEAPAEETPAPSESTDQ